MHSIDMQEHRFENFTKQSTATDVPEKWYEYFCKCESSNL